jgi:virginiamycin B lyase
VGREGGSDKEKDMPRDSLCVAAAALLVMLMQVATPARAQSRATLSGHVSSTEEGAMEGVVVSAKAAGSPMTVSVTSDAQGQYSFPAGRLPAGQYDIKIRAVGYDLNGGTATAQIDDQKTATVDLKLKRAKNITAQLTNADWMMSIPGTDDQKSFLLNCQGCHTLERIVKSTHDAGEFVQVVARMMGYAPGSTPLQPQRRLSAPEAEHPERFQKIAEYLASINLSGTTQWEYPLQTLPRPSGAGTRAIVTEYDLPRANAMPHDVVMDPDGMVWYSDFGSQFLGRLDPKTGKVTDFPVPVLKPDSPKGMLDLEFDKNNDIWIGMMLQAGIAKFDRKTEKFQVWSVPSDLNNGGTQQAMVMPIHASVDGKVWMNDVGFNGVRRVDLASSKFESFEPFKNLAKGHGVYGIFADSANNLYMADFGDLHDAQIGRIDARTGAVTFYPTPTNYSRPRRGRIDSQDRLWFTEYRGNKVAMFDTKAEKFQEWTAPPYTWPYDVVWDKNGDAWTAGMSSDRVVKIDTKSGATTEYMLPRTTNSRRVYIDNSTTPVTFWTGSNHGASIVKLELLE